MLANGTAVTLIAITLLSLTAITAVTLYVLPPLLKPVESDGQHG